jgi:WD domain, G-beta repeat
MSFPVICQACGTRLRLPPGCTKKKARCPKCDARIDLTAALDASAYLPAAATATAAAAPTESGPASASAPAAAPAPAFEREEDPLPYADLNPRSTRATAPPPLPGTGGLRPPPAGVPPTPAPDEVLSLDDAPADPGGHTPGSLVPSGGPAGPPPFRAPARVTADSAGLFTGPCEVVLVPHGLFLESVPYRPFLYVPVRSSVDASGSCGLAVTLPDGRRVALEFTGPHAGRLADDTAAFLAGERGVPDPREYRRAPRWLFLVALVFALGLATGPVVLSQTADLGLATGLWLGAAFAGAGLLANAAVVRFARLPVPGKVAVMAGIGVLVTGVFLLGATAYLAGRRHEAEQPKPEPPPPKPPEPKPPEPKPPDPPRHHLPTPVDAAYAEGVYRFEDGPDEVTGLAVGVGGSTLVVGYRDGTTRVWNFDQATIDPFAVGPKSDGPPSRIEFDGTGTVVYMSCNGGTVAALWNTPPAVPVKIPGEHFAAHPFPTGERFAAVRGNTVALRYVPTALLKKPPKGPKEFLLTTPKDETIPADAKVPLAVPPQRPTFLAWHPTGKLLAGQPDGSILSWGATGPAYSLLAREHKAPVRAWAAAPGTWDFATGDDKGVVGVWANKATTPRTFVASPAAVTQLSFSPSGSLLAVGDAAGVVRVWDLAANRAILRKTRAAGRVAFGPHDDLLLLSDGKAVELWHVPELAKQP